ncbi:hypothetical protein CKO50_06940 [Pseudoalteromonas sp. HM-SA03]|uniref:tetratricopeptide repeat protein n=1 Tax=Pseudoalteromonas sp. HM-SA03 TaxID=2029678 RepID=UPI000BADFAC6|nr:SEL1-like repeat protein [Pseudoalteromonas sp. HM-SA03]PAY02025.1 hypothetical protein CKO50_06940 [Pseudoalteromonas sp. HM-SA03]
MDQNSTDNSANHDLEQQLLNVLEFVTSPLKADAKFPDLHDNTQALKKGLYYLKEKSFPLAAKWLRLAAMSGDLKAQFFLGLLFMKGQGVPSSPFHAAAWLSLASSQGHKGAEQVLLDVRHFLTTKRFRDAQCYAATLYEQIHQLQHISQ